VDHENLLLVEGIDDLHLTAHLLKRYGHEGVIYIEKREGISKLLKSLRTFLKDDSIKRLGIIVDANSDLLARWQAIRNRLMASGTVALPNSPNAEGTIAVIDQGYRKLRVGVWLMPDNQSPGMLEDFAGQLVPIKDDLWDKAKLNVDEIVTARFPKEHTSKAYIYTWLAWQKEPGKPLGLAIRARYLDANSAAGQKLIAFLKGLFEL